MRVAAYVRHRRCGGGACPRAPSPGVRGYVRDAAARVHLCVSVRADRLTPCAWLPELTRVRSMLRRVCVHL